MYKKAFESLTPGRQRGYLIFFSAAKQPETRFARIEKYTKQILCGKGITDCTCGLSKRMPSCDGSHRLLTKTKISPGWQSSALQIDSRVLKRMAFALPVFNMDKFESVIPTFSDSSFNDIFRLAIITSKFTTIAIL